MLLAVPDKFRGTATAREVARAVARAAEALGWSVHQLPLADGGEGLLDALDPLDPLDPLDGLEGSRVSIEVTGPLGRPVEAGWLDLGPVAVVEMAMASGLVLAGGAEGNDPVAATSRGTGELIVAAARSGSTPRRTVVVGLGGSATTDGGAGAVAAIEEAGGLGSVELIGACDVDVTFIEAAARFGPQKGADPAQVAALEARLEQVARRYQATYGVDVRPVVGAGAAGGLGGAIVALGGRLRSGYRVVAELLGLADRMEQCQLVVTGEGSFDATSLMGKVVGSVLEDATALGLAVLVIAGRVQPEAAAAAAAMGVTGVTGQRAVTVVSLTDRFGSERALGDTERCVEEALAEYLDRRRPVTVDR
jgi:glycerate kinase